MGAYKKDAHTTVWAFFCAYDFFIFYSKSIIFFIIETYINRYILINIFRVNKILSPPEYGLTHIFFYSILLYSILNLIFCSNKIYLIINQIFLSIYFILNIYPITIGRTGFEDNISMMYFFTNILIIILLHLINLYQFKHLKN